MHIGIFVKDKCYSSDFCQIDSCVWNNYVRSEKLFVSEMYGIKYNNYVNIVRNVLVGSVSVFLVFCGVFVCFVCLRSVSCAQCCLCHSIVHSWSALRFCALFLMLPASFNCSFLIGPSVLCLVPNVACVIQLFILDRPCGSVSCSQCCLCHSIVHSWSALRFCVLFLMSPASFNCSLLIGPSVLCLVPNVACVIQLFTLDRPFGSVSCS